MPKDSQHAIDVLYIFGDLFKKNKRILAIQSHILPKTNIHDDQGQLHNVHVGIGINVKRAVRIA